MLVQFYVYERSLALRDPAKHELIEKFRTSKDCSWVNSLKKSFTTKDIVSSSAVTGWCTSYEIAKAEGMDHESELFKGLLLCLETRPADEWPDEGMHSVYKRMNLAGYLYDKENLVVKKHEDTNADEIGAASTEACGKKAMFSLICII